MPEKAGSSENCISGLLNKSSSTEQPAELSSSTTPLPPLSLLTPFSKSPAAKKKRNKSLKVKHWCWLAGVGEFGV